MRIFTSAAIVATAAAVTLLSGCSTDPTAATPSTTSTPASSAASKGSAATAGLKCTTAPAARDSTPTLKLPDKSTVAGKTFVATIQTTCGTVTAKLFADKAPQTVASFIALAKSYYTGTPCPRLVTSGIFVLQCGDPSGTGSGSPGYSFGMENAPTDGKYSSGTLAMARSHDPNSNGGQFFIVYQDTEIPDPTGYSIFGKVSSSSGLGILRAVAGKGDDGTNQAGGGAPVQPIGIQKITVTEKKA